MKYRSLCISFLVIILFTSHYLSPLVSHFSHSSRSLSPIYNTLSLSHDLSFVYGGKSWQLFIHRRWCCGFGVGAIGEPVLWTMGGFQFHFGFDIDGGFAMVRLLVLQPWVRWWFDGGFEFGIVYGNGFEVGIVYGDGFEGGFIDGGFFYTRRNWWVWVVEFDSHGDIGQLANDFMKQFER